LAIVAWATICCYIGILIAIPAQFFNSKLLGAVLKIPLDVFRNAGITVQIKGG
jgi:hypothetical protein